MATKTGGGLLLVGIIVVGLVAVFGVSKVVDVVEGIFGGNDPVIVGEGDVALMVAADARSKVKPCTAERIIQDKQCDNLKIVVIDAAKMSFIARNIQLAWAAGKPFILHRDSAARPANYKKSCQSGFVKKYPDKGSCDEFPFASTQEGGVSARTEEVHLDEQNCQGGTISRAYQDRPIGQGEQFLVVISRPDKIAKQPWQGEEVRPIAC